MKKKIIKITAIVLAAIVLLFAIIAFTVTKILLDDMFGRAEAGNEIFSADDIIRQRGQHSPRLRLGRTR